MAARLAELGPALEVAAGTGIVTRAMLAAVPEAEIVATDEMRVVVEPGREEVAYDGGAAADPTGRGDRA